jgi:hypothetical protein
MQTTSELITELTLQNTEMRQQLQNNFDSELRIKNTLGLYHSATVEEVTNAIQKLQTRAKLAQAVLNS